MAPGQAFENMILKDVNFEVDPVALPTFIYSTEYYYVASSYCIPTLENIQVVYEMVWST